MQAGHGFGLGFAVRTHDGMAPFPGSRGNFFWSGMAGTFFWIDPKEDLFAVFMMQGRASANTSGPCCGIWCTRRWSNLCCRAPPPGRPNGRPMTGSGGAPSTP